MNKKNLTHLFNNINLNGKSIFIETNENTYLPESEPETGWLPEIIKIYSDKELKYLKGKDFFIVGSGAAVEAISMCHNLAPKNLYCSDINENVLPIAKKNLKNNCDNNNINFHFIKSDLVTYLIENNIKVDLIHENLPNLPFEHEDIVLEQTNSASFYADNYYDTPDYISTNRLELHYNLLKDSLNVLNEKGIVISCIGGRVDFSVIKKMYNDLNYEIELLKIFMVEQLAADTVLTGYIETQNKYNNQFIFFDYFEGKERLDMLISKYKNRIDIIFKEMFKIGFDAKIAKRKLTLNNRIGHIGLIIKAQKIEK